MYAKVLECIGEMTMLVSRLATSLALNSTHFDSSNFRAQGDHVIQLLRLAGLCTEVTVYGRDYDSSYVFSDHNQVGEIGNTSEMHMSEFENSIVEDKQVDDNINYHRPKKPYPQYYYGDVIKVTDTHVSLTRTINGTDETYTKPISEFLQNPGTTKYMYHKEVLHKILHHCIEHDRVADRKIKIAKCGIRYNRKYGFDIFNEWISEINNNN